MMLVLKISLEKKEAFHISFWKVMIGIELAIVFQNNKIKLWNTALHHLVVSLCIKLKLFVFSIGTIIESEGDTGSTAPVLTLLTSMLFQTLRGHSWPESCTMAIKVMIHLKHYAPHNFSPLLQPCCQRYSSVPALISGKLNTNY